VLFGVLFVNAEIFMDISWRDGGPRKWAQYATMVVCFYAIFFTCLQMTSLRQFRDGSFSFHTKEVSSLKKLAESFFFFTQPKIQGTESITPVLH
jgi:hypothetical protein